MSTPRKLGQVVRDEPPVAPGEAKVPTGCSTTGPSEAAMLAGLELTRRSHDTADLLLRISSSTCRLEKQPTPP